MKGLSISNEQCILYSSVGDEYIQVITKMLCICGTQTVIYFDPPAS